MRAKAAKNFSRWQAVLLVIANVLVLPSDQGDVCWKTRRHPTQIRRHCGPPGIRRLGDSDVAHLPEDAHPKNVSIFDVDEHLQACGPPLRFASRGAPGLRGAD